MESTQQKKGQKLLLVDDEDTYLTYLYYMLKAEQFECLCASSGDEALELLKKNKDIVAIILDWVMPGTNGLDLAKKVMAMPEFSHIPIILQTAKNSMNDIMEGKKQGITYYITKPFEKGKLLSTLHSALHTQKNP